MTLPQVASRTASEYVEALIGLTNDIAAALRSATAEELRRSTAAEEWPVVVVAHHACAVQRFFTNVFDAFLAGRPVPSFTAEDVDRNNADHAHQFCDVSRKETLACLERSSAGLAAAIRRFSPDQFDESVGQMVGMDMTIAQILEFALIGHFQDHLASIRETTGE